MIKGRSFRRGRKYIILFPVIMTALFLFLGDRIVRYTSTNEFCNACHVHPHAEDSWKKSTHYDNKSGIYVQCAECHLPPPGNIRYLMAKAKHGSKDVYGWIFKDPESINWEAKRTVDKAVDFTYDESCIKCHQNLFPMQLTPDGQQAHLYYNQNEDELSCLNCHLHVGHYSEIVQEGIEFGVADEEESEIFTEPAYIDSFDDFNEKIPGTAVSFDMIAIPGGTFMMGSPPEEPYREEDEGPVRDVQLSPFFIGRLEVTWDEFLAFYNETASEGRQDNIYATNQGDVDAITGPTPPWGLPGQGWGMGSRPAITMTWYAADTYCRWLSAKTGKTYRLPTEAEWEYAARAGTEGPYFFEGDPRKFSRDRFLNRIFGPDTAVINTYVVYSENSQSRTQPPGAVRSNPFGLENMLGNVYEFCSDWYSADIYSMYPDNQVVTDPQGPVSGTERVIRGGSFNSGAEEVRVASRSHTRHDAWQMTDPQIPKSIWWYTDIREVGFRVVCEWDAGE
ncbi:MAG: SUMF1/EgtB/PvdO family nonheme iron enzyme [Bacteroidales bacterium]